MNGTDFELRIHSAPEGMETVYRVSAGCALAGEALNRGARLRLSGHDLSCIRQGLHLERPVASWDDSLGDRAARDLSLARPVVGACVPDPRGLGSLLFRTFFAGDVGALFYESLASLRQARGGVLAVKIRLDAHDPELSRLNLLPWELLYDERHARFLALSGRTSVVRHLMVQQPFEPSPSPSRLRLLVAVANPPDTGALEVAKELKAIEILASRSRGLCIEVLRGTSLTHLSERLETARERGRPFHVLHFIGHGRLDPESGRGELLLSSEDQIAVAVPGEQLARELADWDLRLVFLNACLTTRTGQELVREQASLTAALGSVAGALTVAGIPQVVAMQQPISDSAALRLSEAFYRRALRGETVASSLQAARMPLTRESRTQSEWSTPVLIQRVPDRPLYQPSVRWGLRVALALGMILLGMLAAFWLHSPPGPCEQRVPRSIESRTEALAAEVQRTLHDLQRLRVLREELLRIVESRGSYALALSTLAFTEDRLGLPAEAGRHFRAAVERLPECAHHHYNLGSFARRQGDLETAVLHLRRSVELDPGHLAARNELGRALLTLQAPKEARQVLREGVARAGSGEPLLAPLLRNLGRAELGCGAAIEALHNLSAALDATPPGDWQAIDEIHVLIAKAHQVRGDSGAACRALRARFAHREERGIPSQQQAAVLAQWLGCGFDARPRLPQADLPKPGVRRGSGRSDTSRVSAIVTRVQAADGGAGVTVTGPSVGERTHPRRLRMWEILPAGSRVRLGPGDSLGLVCSDERWVSRHNRATSWTAEITIDETTCRLGRPLPPGSFHSLLPEPERLVQVGESLALEHATRHPPRDRFVPHLIRPRNAVVLEGRPRIQWTAVPDALEYEIALVGPRPFHIRIPSGEAACRWEPAWPDRKVCSTAWPEDHPGLKPGSTSFLDVGVRFGLAQPLRTAGGPSPWIQRASGEETGAVL